MSEKVSNDQNNVKLVDIKIIKLVTGEDIITFIEALADQVIIVKRPSRITKIVDNDGNSITIIFKWQPYSNCEDHIINVSAIVSYSIPNPKLIEYYLKSIDQQIMDESKTNTEYEWPSELEDILKSGDKSKLN